MKTANFPERKRQRQLRAIERMRLPAPDRKRPRNNPRSPLDYHNELQMLMRKVAANARDVRTKKDRSATAQFARNS
jgi:hypothetical protein